MASPKLLKPQQQERGRSFNLLNDADASMRKRGRSNSSSSCNRWKMDDADCRRFSGNSALQRQQLGSRGDDNMRKRPYEHSPPNKPRFNQQQQQQQQQLQQRRFTNDGAVTQSSSKNQQQRRTSEPLQQRRNSSASSASSSQQQERRYSDVRDQQRSTSNQQQQQQQRGREPHQRSASNHDDAQHRFSSSQQRRSPSKSHHNPRRHEIRRASSWREPSVSNHHHYPPQPPGNKVRSNYNNDYLYSPRSSPAGNRSNSNHHHEDRGENMRSADRRFSDNGLQHRRFSSTNSPRSDYVTAASVAQQQKSRLGSRWGPRVDAVGGTTPDLLTTPPEDVDKGPKEAAKGESARFEAAFPFEKKKGVDPNHVKGPGAGTSIVEHRNASYEPVRLAGSTETEAVLPKDGVNSSNLAGPSTPSPMISPAHCGFTAKENRAVETTELTEASTATMTTMDATAHNNCVPSVLPPPTTPPPLVVLRHGKESASRTSNWTAPSTPQPSDANPVSLNGRIPTKKSSSVSAICDLNGRRSGEDCHTPVKTANVPEVLLSEMPRRDESSSPYCLAKPTKKRRLETASSEECTDEPPSLSLAESDDGVVTASGTKREMKRKIESRASRDCQDPSLVTVGARVAVFWDGEGEYFPCTVTKEVPGKLKPFFVQYDDGDKEWMTFHGERFLLLSTPSGGSKGQKQRTDGGNDASKAVDGPECIAEHEPQTKKIATKEKKKVSDAGLNGNGCAEEDDKHSGPTKATDLDPRKESSCDSRRGTSNGRNSAREKRKKSHDSNATEEIIAVDNGRSGTCERSQVKPGLKPKNKRSWPPNETKTAAQLKRSDVSGVSKVKEAWASKKDSPEEKATTIPVPSDAKANHRQRSSVSVHNEDRAEGNDGVEQDWVTAGISRDDSSNSDSDSETDEEELMHWAARMFGISQPIARQLETAADEQQRDSKPAAAMPDSSWDDVWYAEDVPMSISEKVKLNRQSRSNAVSYSLTSPTRRQSKPCPKKDPLQMKTMAEAVKAEEAKRKKEQARPLTAAEISCILGEDSPLMASSSWVRRSVRQPSKSSLNAPPVKALLEKLRSNDSDMVVLKMKKYCSDLDTPTLVIDAVLDALEENTNCEALYIQNFNEGMRDEQVLHLLRVLQLQSCKIWCLNIGETYKVQMKTWERFTNGLKDTKITHMYTSEHTITAELKDQIRETIRLNRRKHNMHCDPNNLDTIVQCTHCWWNPINTKSLRPYVQKKGYEHILGDAEAQGLQGTVSGATLS